MGIVAVFRAPLFTQHWSESSKRTSDLRIDHRQVLQQHAFTRVKIAAFAPIPSASVSTADNRKAGRLSELPDAIAEDLEEGSQGRSLDVVREIALARSQPRRTQ